MAQTDPASSAGEVPTSHPTGFWFFFWGELAERCCYYGMRTILPLFLSKELNFTEAQTSSVNYYFFALVYFMPLLGGYIADRYLGKYLTIVIFSVPYVLSQFLLCTTDRDFLYISLVGLAVGSGVIKPNISTLMGLTYDQKRPGQTVLRTTAFSMFYFAINFGSALSTLALPKVASMYGYSVAFAVPGVLMIIALTIFALGKRYYAVETPGVAAPDEKPGEKWQVLLQIAPLFLLIMFFWAVFDQSSVGWVLFAAKYLDTNLLGIELDPAQFQAVNPILICLMVPFSTLFFARRAKAGRPIKATTKMLVGFILTALSMVIMAVPGKLAGTPTTKTYFTTSEGRFVLPEITSRQEGEGSSTYQLGDGVSLAINGKLEKKDGEEVASFTSGTLTLPKGTIVVADGHIDPKAGTYPLNEVALSDTFLEFKWVGDTPPTEKASDLGSNNKAGLKQDGWVFPAERASVLWMVLAYIVITAAEILISITGLELAYVVAPRSLSGFVTACWLATVGLANLAINKPVSGLYATMTPSDYFLMLAVAGAVVTVLFIPVARRFDLMLALKARNAAATQEMPPSRPDA